MFKCRGEGKMYLLIRLKKWFHYSLFFHFAVCPSMFCLTAPSQGMSGIR
jgi:hypothetical protein